MKRMNIKLKDSTGAIVQELPLTDYVRNICLEEQSSLGVIENIKNNQEFMAEILGRILNYLAAKDSRIGCAELEAFLFGTPTGQIGGLVVAPEKTDDDIPF